MELEAKEEKIRTTGKPGLTNEEEQEYLELTRKQTGSKGWTPEDWEKLRELEKGVSGCRAWSRTKINGFKGRCATITPPGNVYSFCPMILRKASSRGS